MQPTFKPPQQKLEWNPVLIDYTWTVPEDADIVGLFIEWDRYLRPNSELYFGTLINTMGYKDRPTEVTHTVMFSNPKYFEMFADMIASN